MFGYRTIEPKSASVILKKNNHIQIVEFEVVQRRRFFGFILGAGHIGAIFALVLQRDTPNHSRLGILPLGIVTSSLYSTAASPSQR